MGNLTIPSNVVGIIAGCITIIATILTIHLTLLQIRSHSKKQQLPPTYPQQLPPVSVQPYLPPSIPPPYRFTLQLLENINRGANWQGGLFFAANLVGGIIVVFFLGFGLLGVLVVFLIACGAAVLAANDHVKKETDEEFKNQDELEKKIKEMKRNNQTFI